MQNITSIVKNLSKDKSIKSIPLDDYVEGSAYIQSFLKNMENKSYINQSDLRNLYEFSPIARVSGYTDPIHNKIFKDLANKINLDLGTEDYILPFIR